MDIKNRVAIRIRALRRRRGLSQEGLAKLIARSPDTISNIERGISVPGYETLDLLAKGLGVPLSDLLADEAGEKEPERLAAMTRLMDAARQLDLRMLNTAAAIIEILARSER